MANSWEKVRMFLDSMDVQDLRTKLPSSFSSFSSSSGSNSDLYPLSISARSWKVCENTSQQILSVIQPNSYSEIKRKEIIEYLQVLIEDAFGNKVFPFGSVPLKTYLPHGDIDLTIVSPGTSEDLAAEICILLEYEEKNNTYIQVKDVLCVPAQVRVVKCTVGGVSVDISVNQTAGLSALYFLEQVDRFIGKDHLFKRSVILIKAWCYYESRLLGGFHGLISTYALETMVLHVINLFHSSIHCPLAVLYKFLDYYSKFDWNSFCIGFNGLVLISSLPDLVVQLPADCNDLLLTDAFLRSSREAILTSMGIDKNRSPAFPVKFLNILDPLRDDNNLGRSVNKGNFYRIRSALSYGAQKLGDSLMLPLERIGNGLEKFFQVTLEMNGRGRRADVVVPVPAYGSENSADSSDSDHLLSGMEYGFWFHDFSMIYPVMPKTSANLRIWNNRWADMGTQNMQFDQNMYYSPPSYAEGFSTEGWKSRGTGTYIPHPHLGHFLRRNIVVKTSREDRGKEQEVGKVAEGPDSPACTPKEVNHSDELGNVEVFDFSIEEFPLLPGSKPIPIKVNQLEPYKPEQVKDTPASPDSLEFDSLKQSSPRSLSFSEVGKQSDSDGSVVLDLVNDQTTVTTPEGQEAKTEPTTVTTPKGQEAKTEPTTVTTPKGQEAKTEPTTMTTPKGQEANTEPTTVATPEDQEAKTEEKEVAPVQPLQLADDNEFPPLSRPPEPVITLSKKEFPPLRSCLKLQKRSKLRKGFK